MSTKHLMLGAAVVFVAGMLAGRGLVAAGPAPGPAAAAPAEAGIKVVFDNPRVAVREVTIPPKGQRSPRVRDTDEVVLFCAESHYAAVKADGTREPRDRKAGTVVFHSKGEQAPTLINEGKQPVRYLSLSLKR